MSLSRRLSDWNPLSSLLGAGVTPAEIPAALTGRGFVCLDTDAGRLWMPADDEVMRPYLARTGSWEPEEGALLLDLAQPGCRFLDIGANVGYFSLLIAAKVAGATIDCVEPHPGNLDVLRFNLWANGVAARVWPVALDDQHRSLTMSVAATNYGDARVGTVDAGDETVADLVVPATAGRDLFRGRVFDLIKIDVQGWELDVITGLTPVLAASPEVAIVAEFWPEALRQRGQSPVSTLHRYRELGLDFVVQVAGNLRRLDVEETVRTADTGGPDGQVNLLLRHRGKL